MSKTTGSYGTMYYVKDMEKVAAFYRAALGVEPRYQSSEWTEFDLGDGTSLCLHGVGPGQKRLAEGGVLIAKVSDLKGVVAGLKEQKVELLRDIHEVHPGAYSADFRDPEGNVVSLYERAD